MSQPDGSKCIKCGRCCLHKVMYPWMSLAAVSERSRCPAYDPETKLCRDFDVRHQKWAHCLPIDKAAEQRCLPQDCPCVADVEGYVSLADYDIIPIPTTSGAK